MRRAILFLAAAAALAWGVQAQAGWRPADSVECGSGNHCKVFFESVSWHEAKKACEKAGGRLASIEGKDKNNDLAGLAKGKPVWVGGVDKGGAGVWAWANNSPFVHHFFEFPPPKDPKGQDRYLILNSPEKYKWGAGPDKAGEHSKGFVCEWDN